MTDLPRVRLRDLVRGAVRWTPRLPRTAHALLTVLRADGGARVSMGSLVERNGRRHRDETALLFDDARWTWRELNLDANRLAHAFTSLGIGHGDVVALLVETGHVSAVLATAITLVLAFFVRFVFHSLVVYAPRKAGEPSKARRVVEEIDDLASAPGEL